MSPKPTPPSRHPPRERGRPASDAPAAAPPAPEPARPAEPVTAPVPACGAPSTPLGPPMATANNSSASRPVSDISPGRFTLDSPSTAEEVERARKEAEAVRQRDVAARERWDGDLAVRYPLATGRFGILSLVTQNAPPGAWAAFVEREEPGLAEEEEVLKEERASAKEAAVRKAQRRERQRKARETREERLRAVEEAVRAQKAALPPPTVPAMTGPRDWRPEALGLIAQGVSVSEVARRLSVHRSRIYRAPELAAVVRRRRATMRGDLRGGFRTDEGDIETAAD